MPSVKERKKARRRIKKPRKIPTNKSGFIPHNSKVKIKVNKPKRTKVYNPYRNYYTKGIKIPKVITIKLNTRKSAVNQYGLPKRTTPKVLQTKRNQVINDLINKGIKPSAIKEVRNNWNNLIKAANYYSKAKKPETKRKWQDEINMLSKNILLFGFSSPKYENGVRTASVKTVNPNSETAKKYQELFKKAKGEDDYEDEEGFSFTGGIFYDLETVDSIIMNMAGGSWIGAIMKYGNDVKRIVNNAGYNMTEYRDHFENGTELGTPDLDLVNLKRG